MRSTSQGQVPKTRPPDPLRVKSTMAPQLINAGLTYFFLLGSPPLRDEMAKEVAEQLSSRLGTNNISVRIRLDPWFITDDSFPIVYVFQNGLRPPSADEYKKSPEASCWIDEKGRSH